MEQKQEITILEIIKRSDVPETEALVLASHFSEFEKQAREWKEIAEKITVTSVDQKQEMAKAREGRLILVKVRTGIAKKHKELKEQALKEGRLYDLIKNTLTSFVEPIEEHLEAQENFEKNLIAAQKAELQHERASLLAEYMQDAHSMPLADMNDDAFNNLLTGQKMASEARIEAEKKAEAERIENQKREAEEREKQRLENIRLRAEAEVREQELAEQREAESAKLKEIEEKNRLEREESDRKLAAERQEKERIEKELREKQAKEEQEKKDAAAAERKLKRAGDNTKLQVIADKVFALQEEINEIKMKSEDSEQVRLNIIDLLVKVHRYTIKHIE